MKKTAVAKPITWIEVRHIRTGEVRSLEYSGSDTDGNALLHWPTAGYEPFDIRHGGGLVAKSWMITDAGLLTLGLGERRAQPPELLAYQVMVAAGRGEAKVPGRKVRRNPPKVHPKQLPLIGSGEPK